ncbi:MAG: Gfo/Idh/MocA family oxidoreductase [Gemmatimonadales bacterium]|nr:Gfo/Idh/MocA family oxidoreductase [Gemmatimonadales bacterium]
MRSYGVGVIGCGYWGPNLVRNFSRNPRTNVLAVCDSRHERAVRVAAEFRIPTVTDQANELITAPGVDLVVVATPSFTHFALARAALEAGKHVLVMKPLTTSVDHAEELCDLAQRKGLLMAVDHTFVFTGAVRRMKALIDAGEIGDLYYFDSVRINLGLIQTDINVVWDLAPHDVSIMDYLIDQEPVSVAAQAACHGGSPTENIAYLTVRYAGSLLGAVHVNWLAPAKVRRTIVGGSKRMMIYDDMEPSEKLKVYDKGVSISSDPTGESQEYQFMISYRSGDMHAPQLDMREALAVEVENIVAALDGREPLVADGRGGARVVRILEAAQRSIEQGGALVATSGPAPVGA